MLRENEKKIIDAGLETGRSYQEIAQDLLQWRYQFTVLDLSNEIRAYAEENEK
jgi:hypothetical protein